MQEKRHDFLYILRAELKGPEMLSLVSAMLVGQRVLWQGHPIQQKGSRRGKPSGVGKTSQEPEFRDIA